MKHVYGLVIAIVLLPAFVSAQDEGQITKKARIERSNNIFINAGPSIPFGKNIGDYGTGINFEIGYTKRLNRLLSVGPSISILRFSYEAEPTDLYSGNIYDGEGSIGTSWYGSEYANWLEKYPGLADLEPPVTSFDFRYVLKLTGGDLSMTTLAANIKANLVPVKDTSPVSVYLFLKPFITSGVREAVYGVGERYVYQAFEDFNGGDFDPDDRGTPNANFEGDDVLYYNTDDGEWYKDGYEDDWGPDGYEALAEDKFVTGGIFLGPGFEFLPGRRISIFFQPTIGYTFPISFVSTKSYDNTSESYLNEEFPIVKKGFTSLSLQLGVSYNF
jgi:hypothetical protein